MFYKPVAIVMFPAEVTSMITAEKLNITYRLSRGASLSWTARLALKREKSIFESLTCGFNQPN